MSCFGKGEISSASSKSVTDGLFLAPDSNTKSIQLCESYLLAVDDVGKIVFFDESSSNTARHLLQSAADDPSFQVLEMDKDTFCLPTFVDCHLHAVRKLGCECDRKIGGPSIARFAASIPVCGNCIVSLTSYTAASFSEYIGAAICL